MKTSKEWKTAPISCTCEVLLPVPGEVFCEEPTFAAYPAWGGGWMALCHNHAQKHRYEATATNLLIHSGETWA